MGESGSGSGIGKIIGRDVDGLDGGNGTLLGGGNSFLEGTQIGSQSGLITDGRGDTTQKGRHFRTSLSESEDVINEQQHILSLFLFFRIEFLFKKIYFFISEVFGKGKTSKTDSSSGTRGFVHLTVDQGTSGALTINSDDTGGNHFVVKIVTFSGSFTDTGEDGVTTMSLGDVVDEFLNEDSLTDTSTTEKTNLTTSSVGGQKIDDLNTSDQDISTRTLIFESGGISMDGIELLAANGASFIDGFTYEE